MILNDLSGFSAFLFCFLGILGLAQKSVHQFMKLTSHSPYKPSTDTADVTGRWI